MYIYVHIYISLPQLTLFLPKIIQQKLDSTKWKVKH